MSHRQQPTALHSRLALWAIAISAALLFLSKYANGTRVISNGTTTTYRFSLPYVALSLAATFFVLAAAALAATAKIGRYQAWAILAAMLAIGLLLGDTRVIFDHVTVAPDAFVFPNQGFFRGHRVIRYADLGGVLLDRDKNELHFYKKNKTEVVVSADVLFGGSLQSLYKALKSCGVPVANL